MDDEDEKIRQAFGAVAGGPRPAHETETAPEPRKPSLLEAAIASATAQGANWTRYPEEDLKSLLTAAEWTAAQLRAEITTDDWFRRLHGEARKQRFAARLRIELRHVLVNGPAAMADIPEVDALAKLPPVLRKIADGWTPEQGGLLLLGPTGVAKTLTAVCVVRRLVQHELAHLELTRYGHPRIVWARAADLGMARQGHPLGKGEAPLIEDASKERLLVLDDMGWDTRTDAVSDVLQRRYDAGKVTIATSGRTAPELEAMYGTAVVRRIIQSGGKQGRIVSLFPAAKGTT